jgi:plastocyanin domain-containing protein
MTFTVWDWTILAAAAGAIVLVNWYFLGGRRRARAASGGAGLLEVTIRVQGGYDPAEIEVHAGQTVRLTFDRRENNPCSDEIVLPAFGIRRELAPFARTSIEVTPAAPGRYEFACGMGMLHGAIVAR